MTARFHLLWPGVAVAVGLCGCGGEPKPAPLPPITSAPAFSVTTTTAATTSTTLAIIPSPLPAPQPAASTTTTLPPPPTAPIVIPAPVKSTVARTVSLNAIKAELDGQIGGILMATDGNVYFGASTHSGAHGAAFFRFSPRTRELTCLARDVTLLCGEDPASTPQGAIQGAMAEADGCIYFATQFASEREGAAADYPGSHVIAYETGAGKFRDLGILEAGQTASGGVALDAQRKRLYVLTSPLSPEQAARGGKCLVHRIDLVAGKKEVAAELRTGVAHTSAGFFVDIRGDAWFTLSERPGTLYCVRAEAGRPLEQWPGVLPLRYSLRAEEVLPDAQQADRHWTWVRGLPDGERCVFTASEDGMLWQFDAGKATPDPRSAFTPLRHIGPNGPGICMAGERIFYVQRANRREGIRAPRWDANLHLMSLSLTPGDDHEIMDHGLLADQDARRPWRIESLCADGGGRIYLCGDWHLRKGETGVRRYVPRAQDAWQLEARGLFLAVVDLTAGGAKEK